MRDFQSIMQAFNEEFIMISTSPSYASQLEICLIHTQSLIVHLDANQLDAIGITNGSPVGLRHLTAPVFPPTDFESLNRYSGDTAKTGVF